MLSDEKIERLKLLARNGVSIAGIAQEINTDRKTVRKYLGTQSVEDMESYMLSELPMYPTKQPIQPMQMQPMPQRQLPRFMTPEAKKAEAEFNEIIYELDRYSEIYGEEPPTEEERYIEEKIIRNWQKMKFESEREHHHQMNEMRHLISLSKYGHHYP